MHIKYFLFFSLCISFFAFSMEYICTVCNIGFTRESSLKSHKRGKAHFQNIVTRLTKRGETQKLQSPIKKTKRELRLIPTEEEQQKIDTIFYEAIEQLKQNNRLNDQSSSCSS